jgi:phosphatidylserine decarboxylase
MATTRKTPRLVLQALGAWLFVLVQWILPQHVLTAIAFRLARVRNVTCKNFFIRRYVSVFKVDVTEIGTPVPHGFVDFNAFFTRELAPGARSVDSRPATITSPVDGAVSAAGIIKKDLLIQAKGMHYSVEDLLATDLPEAGAFHNGRFATIYLAPFNYHRVHAPLAGTLRAIRYVPGDLFSVNASTAKRVPRLFSRNERLICHFTADDRPFVVILVGALNVGSISTPWTGEIRPRKRGVVADYDLSRSTGSVTLAKGDLLGWFNMGSTVIMLLPAGSGEWSEQLVTGTTLRMGEVIGWR